MKLQIAIVDTQWTGHIPMFHRILTERALYLGHRVVSISPKPGQIFEWSRSLGESLQKNLKIEPYKGALAKPGEGSDKGRARLWWHQVQLHVQSHKPDLVLLPGLETNIISRKITPQEVDTLFPFHWAGIYLTPKYLRKSALKYAYKKWSRKDRFFNAKGCVAISVLDEGVVPRLQKLFPAKPVLTMPDVTDLSLPQKGKEFPLAEKLRVSLKGYKVIGLYGEISERKGVLNFLKVADIALKMKKLWKFLLIGPFNERCNTPASFTLISKELAKKNPLVHSYLERIPNEAHFNEVFCLSDAIFAVYENFYHSSNMLTKAAHFNKPILVSKGYCMGERVQTYDLGWAANENDPDFAFKILENYFENQTPKLDPLKQEKFKSMHSIVALDEYLKTLFSLPRD